ncbi:hypothetical protein PEC18_20935 [Paucibacter sp. O1-1]|uniref:hypothetical protein n=1 Tax=Paucibacter sp. M5-1 TaxID=3015998 RepID=UPI0021D4A302|nr:hypothetical protein [Paucibacter sp. M5-1]MCU7373220.1 hypothetical protein [Paucibacter sp. O1-1]MCZ7879516.1 hypothetical protein [Paucibacter sp. M5-1]MDA3828219.1 hypothetical protein [Paucibacter sp. O1-1]
MREENEITSRVIAWFDQIEFTPYSAWSQHYFNNRGGETHEGLAFCAPRSEVAHVEQFIAAAVFRVLNFFHYSRSEIREMLVGAVVRSAGGELEHCDAWRGLANTHVQGSVDMLDALRAAHPDLQPEYAIFDLDGSINSFAFAANQRSYVALYWYTTG